MKICEEKIPPLMVFQELFNENVLFARGINWLYPDKTDAYSWWSYRAQSRARNVGWRIDYFIVSERLRARIENADILPEVMGSDHCPVMLELKEETV